MNTKILIGIPMVGSMTSVAPGCGNTPKHTDDLSHPKYKDASLPVEIRVEDLIGRMTVDEKLAQLQGIWVKRHQLENDAGEFIADHASEILGQGIGQISRPSENKWPDSANKSPRATAEFVNAVQGWLLENTRLGIPAIFHEEALHGHAAVDATSFPQAIALASTWDTALVENVYTLAAQEMRARGGQQALTPVLDVARDPRWGRIEETMGEDPYLVAALGVASVRGFQGPGPGIADDRVIATLKHLAGHGQPDGGNNVAPAHMGERTLREVFLFPFEAAIELTGAKSVMASYNEIDGIPSHVNGQLLNTILRQEWGFDGVVVSDYFALADLVRMHGVAADKTQAAKLALRAGVDVELPDGDTFSYLKELLATGDISEAEIDTAVSRVLRQKFELKLFEHPFVDADYADAFVGREAHRALALEAAEKAMVLLKNTDGLLPINAAELKSIAVIGPHANETLLGGYSDVPRQTVSVLAGIRSYLAASVATNTTTRAVKSVDVGFARGVDFTQPPLLASEDPSASTYSKIRWVQNEVTLVSPADNQPLIREAVELAQRSDVAIVVVGDNEATSREAWAENHLGDRTQINLMGDQQALVDAVLATGTPTVVLLINGRPLAINEINERAPAIIEGWYLGQETGTAVAKVLFGDVNPSGKLPLSFPRSSGHIPAYYNYKPSARRGYAFDEVSPLYPFGFGLSYTQFEYADMSIDDRDAHANGRVKVSVKVTNTGEREGVEIAQLYIRDPIASVTRPVKELKGFHRLYLAAGGTAQVSFELSINQLGFYNSEMQYVVEPGDIHVMLGSSSADIRQQQTFTIVGEVTEVGKNKVYLGTSAAQILAAGNSISRY
ncbi:MAG: beta-glucosidase [Lentisphaeria bacterium]|jgi:beta-glucosidase